MKSTKLNRYARYNRVACDTTIEMYNNIRAVIFSPRGSSYESNARNTTRYAIASKLLDNDESTLEQPHTPSIRTKGQGETSHPKYDPQAGQVRFRLIDFTVDVELVCKTVLDTHELWFFNYFIKDKVFDAEELVVQSETFMRLKERLGRAFVKHGIYPVHRYLEVIRK